MRNVSRKTHPLTRKLLRDVAFCRNVKQRVDAAAEIVSALPQTLADIETLLSHAPHSVSREVQYSVLNMLDWSGMRPLHVKKLFPIVLELLYEVNFSTAILWMKIGCILGDGFLNAADQSTRKRIVVELLNALRSAPSVYSRRAAFHAIEHALNTASLSEGKMMLDVIHETALRDRAPSLRRSAFGMLRDGYWWGNRGLPKLHTYARKHGAALRVEDYCHENWFV